MANHNHAKSYTKAVDKGLKPLYLHEKYVKRSSKLIDGDEIILETFGYDNSLSDDHIRAYLYGLTSGRDVKLNINDIQVVVKGVVYIKVGNLKII